MDSATSLLTEGLCGDDPSLESHHLFASCDLHYTDGDCGKFKTKIYCVNITAK